MPQAQVQLGGRYRLERLVGRGGMAEVWAATDEVLEREVAVKVLSSRFRNDDGFQRRFRREAQQSAGLNHPNIVAVYDTGAHDGLPFIVMELVRGRSLDRILDDGGELTEERALEICADACAALHAAHRRGLIHRDVKPGNILVADDGSVKVTDFGIARAVSAETVTETAAVLGTAAYLSPEQAQGHEVDPRSDVYSMGIVLYEMLVGGPPFTGDTAVGVAYQHVQQTPRPPREHDTRISLAAEAIAMKALSKNPQNRYPSADAMRSDLLSARVGEAVTAPAVLLPAETAVLDRDATAAAAAAPVVTADRPPPTEDEERRRHTAVYVLLTLLVLAAFAAGIWLLTTLLGGEEALMRTVPDVRGDAPDRAQQELQSRGLEIQLAGREYSSDYEAGTVARQDPDPGQQVQDGSTVQVWLSDGPEPAIVPDVRGQLENEAIAALRRAGFVVSRSVESSDDVPRGHVIRTSPGHGEEADRGSTVQMVVSTGVETEIVPRVTGLSESEARFRLEERGFRPRVVRQVSDEEAGRVIRQDPAANERARVGAEVVIVVSEGPPQPSPTPTPTPTPDDTDGDTDGDGDDNGDDADPDEAGDGEG
jgi:eukaryotic-like serine/threonine-protein kinase